MGGVKGIGEAVVMIAKLSPARMLVDPEGWQRDGTNLGKGLWWGITHPVEFGKAIIDWETWKSNPLRAFGKLVPDIAIAIATAGTGTAASASSRAAARGINAAGDVADAAHDVERAADGAGDAADRSPDPREWPALGVSLERFQELSEIARRGAGHLSDDIAIHGSRAKGTAAPDADLDIAIRMPEREFDEFLKERFKTPNPGSSKEDTMLRAIETGKIQAGEAGLRGVRRELERAFGHKVDLSAIKVDGQFDKGPYIQLAP